MQNTIKNILIVILSIIFIGGIINAGTLCYPEDSCTGTITIPKAGHLLIGTSDGIYNPTWLTTGNNIKIATSSGGITISSTDDITNIGYLGSIGTRVTKGWFTDFDATNATIGTLNISASVDPGPLVIATSTNPTIQFKNDTNTGIGWLANDKISLMTGGSSQLTIDSSGNVGIGTTAPGAKLEIKGTNIVNTDAFRISNANGNVVSGNIVGDIQFYGNDTSLYGTGKVASVHAVASADWVGAGRPTDLTFLTNSASGAGNVDPTEKVRITNAGNVGIGTTGPGQKLHIEGASYDVSGIRFNNTANSGGATYWDIGQRSYSASDHGFSIGGSVGNDLFNIDENGNVGIGTTGPLSKLDVNGAITLSNTSIGKPILSAIGATPNVGFKYDAPGAGAGWYGVHDFYTGFNGAASSLAMRIKNGNVGIGTTAPTSLLEVYSSTANTDLTITAATSTTYDSRLVFRTGATPTTKFVLGVDLSDSNKFKIATSTLGTGDLLTIDYGTGNVGIGTTTPAYTLDVHGTLQANNYYSQDGTIGWTGTCSAASSTVVKNGLVVGCQ